MKKCPICGVGVKEGPALAYARASVISRASVTLEPSEQLAERFAASADGKFFGLIELGKGSAQGREEE